MRKSIRVVKVGCFHRWMDTRFPFKYGIASMTRLPHLFLQLRLSVDGCEVDGISSEGLPPKWFTKNPNTRFEDDLSEMLQVIERALLHTMKLETSESVFQLWLGLYKKQTEWALANGAPLLLAHLGTNLVERAVIDAYCRSQGESLGTLVFEDRLGIELDVIHSELTGRFPKEFLPDSPLSRITVRHTIGLEDPLVGLDIPNEEALDDGLPHSLVASIKRYGLRYFKIKVCGDDNLDIPRLLRIAAILKELVPDYRVTLDGNEQFRDVTSFRRQWDNYLKNADLIDLFSKEHLLFVEQPLHRDYALLDAVGAELAHWKDAPPMIIDESDAELSSLPRALSIGYRGTSHKNCKGVFKGIANRCLLNLKNVESKELGPWIMSGEDLANVGPVALLNDLAAMALLGIEHVERNGHHYFAGLSMYSTQVQEEALLEHPDLYEKGANGFPTLKIEDGSLSVASINASPFGCSIANWERFGTRGMPHFGRCLPLD